LSRIFFLFANAVGMGYVMRMKASEGFASTMVLAYSEKNMYIMLAMVAGLCLAVLKKDQD